MSLSSLSRRSLLGSLATAALLPFGMLRAQSLGRPQKLYGWDPQVEGPREASFHVAPHGDDAAPGTLAQPLRSIRRGVALLAERPTGSLAIHAGTYREAIDLSALRGETRPDGSAAYRLHRFGRDHVVITGAEAVTGWRPCPPEVVARLRLPSAGVYMARLPVSALDHGSLWALNLHEAGQFRPVAGFRASRENPGALGNRHSMRTAQFEIRGEREFIHAIRDPALVGLDPSLLADARVLVYRRSNSVSNVVPEGFDPATGTIRLPADPALRLHLDRMLYALQNAPMAMAKGDWYARRDGQSVEIYFWPTEPANLETSVEVSLRDHCIDLGTASSVELFGLEMIRAGGKARASGCCVRRGPGQNMAGGTDLRLIHCRAGENVSAEGAGFGAIYLREAVRPVLRYCTLEACRGNIGLALDKSYDVDVRHLEFRDISRSGARFFSVIGGILAFTRFENTGWDAHSNKFHFYLGSDRILVYGVQTQNTAGYVTYQQASRIHFAFCEFDADPNAQGRALVSQNYAPGSSTIKDSVDGTGDPRPGSTFWYWNLNLLPAKGPKAETNSLSLGPTNGSHTHRIHNCRLHGGGYSTIYTKTTPREREVRSHNHYSGLAHWQSAKRHWVPGPTESIGSTMPRAGRDMRPDLVAEIAPLFPTFHDWDRDIEFRLIDWSAPPIGARVPQG